MNSGEIMPYYYHGSDLVYTDNGSLGASTNPNTKKCPNCHRETDINSEKNVIYVTMTLKLKK